MPVRSVREVVVVEGKYDKQAVLRAVDALVVETRGFGIFKDSEKRAELMQLARERGLIVLTDSDGAGQVIRGRIKGLIDPALVKLAFVPALAGKEKRKDSASGDGLLGVEAMPPAVIVAALEAAGATFEEGAVVTARRWTTADLYALGLSGRADSAALRQAVQARLGLPKHLSARDLCRALEGRVDYDALAAIVAELV